MSTNERNRESEHDERAPSAPPTPLDYTTPEPRPEPTTPRGERVLLGCLAYVMLCIFWFAAASAFSLGWTLTLAGFVNLTAALLGIAVLIRIRYRFSGFGYGVLLALGATLLVLAGIVMLIASTCGVKLGP